MLTASRQPPDWKLLVSSTSGFFLAQPHPLFHLHFPSQAAPHPGTQDVESDLRSPCARLLSSTLVNRVMFGYQCFIFIENFLI